MSVRLNQFLPPLLTALLLWGGYPGGGELPVLVFIALVPLLVALPNTSAVTSLTTGLITGLLHYLLLLYWIVIVLGKYGGLPLFISVPATLLLALYMALYVALFSFCARAILLFFTPSVALFLLPALWVGIDWLRGVLFTGFPWMDIGYSLASVPRLIQLADVFGHHGISYAILFINVLLALLLINRKRHNFARRTLLSSACVFLVLAVVLSESRWRSMSETLADDGNKSLVAGIVQGNIDQTEKWVPENQQRTLNIYVGESQSLFTNEERPDLLVWPETALPFYLQTFRGAAGLHSFVVQYDTALLTGAPWFEVVDQNSKDIRYYNSAQLLLPDFSFGKEYYKSHLVPFGEYVPMKKLLPFLAPLVEAVGDFSPGKIEEPMSWRGGKIGVLVCFESIFPAISREWMKSGANVLVNLTNDAWYGKSSAPYHSMAMSVMRAVETRRQIVRSANTGVSGFIDPLGRITASSEIFVTWSESQKVYLFEGITPFVRWGYLFAPLCLVAGFAGFAFANRYGGKKRTRG